MILTVWAVMWIIILTVIVMIMTVMQGWIFNLVFLHFGDRKLTIYFCYLINASSLTIYICLLCLI